MKKKLLNYCMKQIKNKYPSYDDDKLEIIAYGLEGLYLTFSKIILIFGLGIILGIIENILLLLVLYNIIRFSAFGLHANKSWQCLVISLLMFVGGVYICDYVFIPYLFKIIISFICILLIAKYAPADTEKRPLINKKKRKIYKIISVIVSTIFTILIILFNDNIISNYLLIALVEASLMILPISYKLLKLPYNNYKRYKLSTV